MTHQDHHSGEGAIVQATLPGETAPQPAGVHLRIESRPSKLYALMPGPLPFPNAVSWQEMVFDLGLTAVGGDLEITGLVLRLYAGHQLLLEQRWTAATLRAHTGEESLSVEAGTGLRINAILLTLHGHAHAGMLDALAVARRSDGESVEARLQMPVFYPQQKTALDFPLRGAWWCIQAGDWSDQHKQEVYSQPWALDFVRLGADNRFFAGDGRMLEQHHSWQQPVYAAAGGKVALAHHDMPDMPPGQMPDPLMFRGDPRRLLGNAVAISHANGEFSYYAHLAQASLAVNEGQVVRRGQLLGLVGNSGQSPGPHLHMHLMEGPHLLIDQGLPMRLRNFEAGGAWYAEPTFVPTRLILFGPDERGDAARKAT